MSAGTDYTRCEESAARLTWFGCIRSDSSERLLRLAVARLSAFLARCRDAAFPAVFAVVMTAIAGPAMAQGSPVGGVADFEGGSVTITDINGVTRALTGFGAGIYKQITYGSTTGDDADVTITPVWGGASIRPSNSGSGYFGGNDITGGVSLAQTNPLVSTSPYLDFTGATQFCFDVFNAALDGTDRNPTISVIIYHAGTPNRHSYNAPVPAAINGVSPATNPTTTPWPTPPAWVNICVDLTNVPVNQIRGFSIGVEGINNAVSDQEKWGLDNIAFVAPEVQADLQLTKTNAALAPNECGSDAAGDSVVSGTTTTYTICVTNAGPGTVTGAVVKDAPATGINCPSGGAVVIVQPAGASSSTISALIGAGITLGTLTQGQKAILTFSCTVI